MQAFIVALLALLLYGIIHSLFAAIVMKRLAKQVFGVRAYEGLYRMIYNLFAGLLLIPIVVYLGLYPGPVLWSARGFEAILLVMIQAIGVIGLAISLLQIDGSRFLGIKQLLAWFSGEPLPLPPEPLQTGGVYQLVRHPLYFFSLLAIWPLPVMTTGLLGFNIGATLYFLVGSVLEEKKLHQYFGAEYETYQQHVPWMIPFIKS